MVVNVIGELGIDNLATLVQQLQLSGHDDRDVGATVVWK